MSKTKILSIIIGILVIAAAAFFFTRGKKMETAEIFKSLGETQNEVEPSVGGSTSNATSNATSNPSLPRSSAPIQNGSDLETYTNTDYGFSFRYPRGINISFFAEGEAGNMILAQKPGSRESFQIFISEFDEPGPITPERIKQDLPDMKIEDPKYVIIGSRTSDGSPTSQKIEALIFFSRNESLGKTREVWWIERGNLYQLTTYADMDNLIGPVLETLTFK